VGDPEAMAAAFRRLLEDRDLYTEMSAQAARRARDFDLPQTGGRVLQIISSL
jgi:glycosyltransferase involved in cell wall biosynthesis